MNNQQAYDSWSATYDTDRNRTRDTEAAALRSVLASIELGEILELGCGTGKNTVWLAERAAALTGADFSREMLAAAKEKITAANVRLRQMDLREPWDFSDNSFDAVTSSLALEHLEDLDFIFAEARRVLRPGGIFYLGELHPFKQYQGGKARFETKSGLFELECFVHHVSDYFAAAAGRSFICLDLREWFDGGDRTPPPRLLTMLFRTEK